jgi:hypothetical protein
MGAIPIISSRWNGGSGIDFPSAGVYKVDHQNVTEINDVIAHVLLNYEKDLTERRDSQEFFQYIFSMKRKLLHTADVYFGEFC